MAVVLKVGPGALCRDRILPADLFLELPLTTKEETRR